MTTGIAIALVRRAIGVDPGLVERAIREGELAYR